MIHAVFALYMLAALVGVQIIHRAVGKGDLAGVVPFREQEALIPNYSRISGIAYENGYVRENSSKTDTLQSFPPNKGALLPWGSDNF